MPRLRRLLPVLVAALLVGAAGCSGGTDAVDQAAGGEFRFVAGTGKGEVIPVTDRKAAPAVGGQLLGGGSWDLAAQHGKVVVLNFWASWCPPCRVESPDLDQVFRATKASGVEFVGVAVKDAEEKAAAFVAAKKISYPSLFDPAGKVVLRFRGFPAIGFPYSIVVDKQGRVAAVYPTALLRGDIEPVVKRLAAEP